MHALTAFDQYQQSRGFSPRTIKRRRWTLRAITAEAERPLDKLTLAQVEAFLSRRRAAETRRALLADMRAYYRWAIPRGYATADPTALIDTPRVPQRTPNPLAVVDVQRLLCGADPRTTRMIALGVFAGLRVSEIGALSRADVHAPTHLVVRNGKGGRDRIVPLHPALADMLDGSPDPIVGLAGHSVSLLLRARLNACGLAHHRPHDLRATFATEAVRVAPIPVVAKWLGHANWTTTQRYVQVSGGDDAIGEMFPMAA